MLYLARNGHNVALLAMKKRDGIPNEIPVAKRKQYETEANKIMGEIKGCLYSAGFLRNDFKLDNLGLLYMILIYTLNGIFDAYYTREKSTSLIKNYFRRRYIMDAEAIELIINDYQTTIDGLIRKIDGILHYISNTNYETHDYAEAEKQLADVLKDILPPMQFETLKWRIGCISLIRGELSEVERTLLCQAFYNVFINAELFKEKINELF
jgi:hypothetical protein